MTQLDDNYRRHQWENLFDRLEEYIIAIVNAANSIHMEDRVYRNELRHALIESLVAKEFNLS